jgi:hypothetical protein
VWCTAQVALSILPPGAMKMVADAFYAVKHDLYFSCLEMIVQQNKSYTVLCNKNI